MSALPPDLCGAPLGAGSLPGADPRAALELIARWAPELPFWPQLPASGPDMLREVEVEPPGLAAFLAAARAGAFPRARALKGQLVGPVTLAAARKAEAPGARAELAERIVRSARRQAEALRAVGLPALLVLDEPVLGLPGGPPADAAELLAPALAAIRVAGAAAGLHVCSPPPWSLLLQLAPDLVSFDAWTDLAAAAADRDCAALLARGAWLGAGIVPTQVELGPLRATELFRSLWAALVHLGDPAALAARTLVGQSCGLGLRPASEVAPSFALARGTGQLIRRLACHPDR